MTNAARRGMDHVGQEQRFGPLVNDQGMTLDDAALQAWEAGYFPERTERPTVNDFLDALRGTQEGYDRRFLPSDLPELERYKAALCLDRIAPPRKDAPISFALPPISTAADTVTASSALLRAVAGGEVTPDEAGRVMALLSAHKALVEAGDLEARIAALEAKR